MQAEIGSLRRLFESQHGVIHRRQALAAGVTRGAIQKKLARGEGVPVLPATYRLSGSPQTWHQRVMAACIWAGPGAVASHRTAAALLDLPGFKPGIIEITTSRRPSAAGIIVHRCRMNARIDNSTCDRIPHYGCTPHDHRSLRRLLARARRESTGRSSGARPQRSGLHVAPTESIGPGRKARCGQASLDVVGALREDSPCGQRLRNRPSSAIDRSGHLWLGAADRDRRRSVRSAA